MLELLRPKPFRGDQVAAGAVMLTVLVLLLNARMAGPWGPPLHLAYTALAAALVLAMAVAAPREVDGPPPWHSALYVTGFILTGAALANLADVLGGDGGAGTFVFVGTALTALGAWISQERGAATGTLLGAVAAVITTLALLEWVASPDEVTATRYLLLVDAALLVLAALWQRVRAPADGVQLLNAAGLTVLGLALTFAVAIFGTVLFGSLNEGNTPTFDIAWGWTVVILASGIGLLAAGAADRERGNVLTGIALLLTFVVLASEGNLLGWPILLGAAAAALLVIGLRPSTPQPTEPPRGPGAPETQVQYPPS